MHSPACARRHWPRAATHSTPSRSSSNGCWQPSSGCSRQDGRSNLQYDALALIGLSAARDDDREIQKDTGLVSLMPRCARGLDLAERAAQFGGERPEAFAATRAIAGLAGLLQRGG